MGCFLLFRFVLVFMIFIESNQINGQFQQPQNQHGNIDQSNNYNQNWSPNYNHRTSVSMTQKPSSSNSQPSTDKHHQTPKPTNHNLPPAQTKTEILSNDYVLLSSKISLWFPKMTTLNEKFVEFLQRENVHYNQADFQRMVNNETFHQTSLSYLKYFCVESVENQNFCKNETMKKLKLNLKSHFKIKSQSEINTILTGLNDLEVNSLTELIYDTAKMRSELTNIFNSKPQNNRNFIVLKEKLDFWYPNLKHFNPTFVAYLKEKILMNYASWTNNLEDFMTKVANKIGFYGFVDQRLDDQVHNQIEDIARKKFGLTPSIARDFVKQIKSNTKIVKTDYIKIYDEDALFKKFSTIIEKIVENLKTEEAFEALRKNLQNWLPNNEEFVNGFMTFLKTENLSEINLKALHAKNNFASEDNIFMKNFITKNKKLFHELILNKTKELLTPNQLELIFNKTKYLLDPKQFELNVISSKIITPDFKIDMIFDDTKLKDFLTKKFPSCLQQLKSSASAEVLKDFICIEKEICGSGTNAKSFDRLSLDVYERASKNMRDNKRFNHNENIKDEIDESIYEAIRNLLEKLQIKNYNCIADYMIRNKAADSFYYPELLFDDDKLKTILAKGNFIKKYERKFPSY